MIFGVIFNEFVYFVVPADSANGSYHINIKTANLFDQHLISLMSNMLTGERWLCY